ncbi:hypothetical protein [Dinghuibacter silviterrae]|uniref:Uncharacterized protein n=1 Tax=Dinghuibacter silviterrae TaxID=1539049 RepID=A0A4R8DUE8_9BACT|nr:hypothetical protein [Dinghuibacter silviterrae]TDX01546.1 hypothetical protein EDB95_2586 [Dinghuibacter silviterrae]
MKKIFLCLVFAGAFSTVMGEAALPVRETWIPDDAFKTITGTYGAQGLYDITMIKGRDGETGYVIRLIKDGKMSTVMTNASGAAI